MHGLAQDLGPYPFEVTGGLSTGLPVGFALENQTRPTYPTLGGPAEGLIVHELAHQWFGDDVAVARWSDIWLNEGAATFMEWRWTERKGTRSAADLLRGAYDSAARRRPVLARSPSATRAGTGSSTTPSTSAAR